MDDLVGSALVRPEDVCVVCGAEVIEGVVQVEMTTEAGVVRRPMHNTCNVQLIKESIDRAVGAMLAMRDGDGEPLNDDQPRR